MPTPGHLTLEGEIQGEIDGSCQIEGREGTILVQGYKHCVDLPADEHGLPSGRRVHRPLMITKEVDKSSPKLFQVLCSGERLSRAKLDWYRLDGTGEEALYFSILMQNAQIVKIESWVPDVLDRANAVYSYMENVWFTYEAIRWTWEEDGIEYEEHWGAGKDKD